MEYGNITCIGLLSAFQHCYTNSLILLLLQARFKKRFQTLRKKTKQLWQKQGVHLVQTSLYSSSDATISIFNFGTLITRCNWIKETEWFEKSLTDSIRQVSTQNFVFFLPMLCNQISSQDHNHQGVLSKNGDMDQYRRTDHMCGNWGSVRSCPFDKSCFFHLKKRDKHCHRHNGPGGWILSPK